MSDEESGQPGSVILGWDPSPSGEVAGEVGNPLGPQTYTVAPTPLPPPGPRRSYTWVIVLVAVLVVGGGGAVWWRTHPTTSTAGPQAPVRTTSASGAHPSTAPKPPPAHQVAPTPPARVRFGSVRVDLPKGFVKLPAAAKGALEYGNAASKPTEHFKLVKYPVATSKKPVAYSAADLNGLGAGWQAAVMTAAKSAACPTPSIAGRRTVTRKPTYVTITLGVACKNAKVQSTVSERLIFAPDRTAYWGSLSASNTLWVRDSRTLNTILPSLLPM